MERIYMILTIGVWFVSEKSWNSNRLNVAYLTTFLAFAAAWLVSPYTDEGWKIIEDLLKVAVFYVLAISCMRNEEDVKFYIRGFAICTMLYMMHSFREYINGRHFYRMGISRMIGVDGTYNDPNSFAACLVYVLPFLLLLLKRAQTRSEKMVWLSFLGLTGMSILLTGSRTGFVAAAFFLFFVALQVKHKVKYFIVLMAILPIVWILLPAELQGRFATLIDPSDGPSNAQVSAESRWTYFEISVQIFEEHPLLGRGPGSFPIASGTSMQAHSLYAQLLSETGLFGTIAFCLIPISIWINHREIMKASSVLPGSERTFFAEVSRAVVLAILLHFVLGLGGHNLYRYTWLWFGAFQVGATCLSKTRYQVPG